MEKDSLIKEKGASGNFKVKKVQDARKSLNNYLNQLKFHFELNENEIDSIIKSVLDSRIKENTPKKWWQR